MTSAGTGKPLLVIAPTYSWFRDWCRKAGIGYRDAVYVHHFMGLLGADGQEVVIVDGHACDGPAYHEALKMRDAGRITIRHETT